MRSDDGPDCLVQVSMTKSGFRMRTHRKLVIDKIG